MVASARASLLPDLTGPGRRLASAARRLERVAVASKVARMVGYPMRHKLRGPPSEDQRKFLETLRDLGPRDNAQTAAIRKSTKRACQVRGWVEWRCLDDVPCKSPLCTSLSLAAAKLLARARESGRCRSGAACPQISSARSVALLISGSHGGGGAGAAAPGCTVAPLASREITGDPGARHLETSSCPPEAAAFRRRYQDFPDDKYSLRDAHL